MKKNRILIVGGGASGLISAIAAGRNGSKVTIVEKNDRVGRKILATGNGRCNFTNINTDLHYFHGSNVKFAQGVLKSFDFEQSLSFFEYLGISYKVEEGGKVFPMSDQASSLVDVLRYKIKKLNVEEYCNAEVIRIQKKKNEFELILKNNEIIRGDKVILATGGKASPQLGSDGEGYRLAQELGHRLTDIFPALVQLKLKANFLKAISGVKFIGQASLVSDDHTIRTENGEILFTNYGVSGPPILQLSRMANEELMKGNIAYIKIDIFPELNSQELLEMLQMRLSYQAEKTLEFGFVGLLNKKLIPVILREADIKNLEKECGKVTLEEVKKIVFTLKNWRIEIVGTQSWRNAQVTAGGINTDEIDGKTMESKFVPGLYFAGEILDIDGDCGGFNLQWAWSSGYIAGESASITSTKPL